MTEYSTSGRRPVLSEATGLAAGSAVWAKRAALVALGVAALAIAAKIKIPMWPVPVTMQTFVVLSVGAAYGARLGVATILAYLVVGALGADVFTSSSEANNGIAYMLGGTGGYLLGYVLAAAALGALARRGWDRDIVSMAAAMLIGTALIYAPGVLWLGHLYVGTVSEAGVVRDWALMLDWGLWPFLIGDALKLALAVILFPAAWRVVGNARV